MGYEHADVVDRHGEFSRRGGIIDVYASNEDDPLRIELFGDQIESIRHFDSSTQRSFDKIPSALILPAREILMTEENAARAAARIRKELDAQVKSLLETGDSESAERLSEKVNDAITRIDNLAYFDDFEFYLPYLQAEEVSIFDYLPRETIVVLDEPMQVKSHWEQHEEHMVETLINRAGRGVLLASQQRQHVSFESGIKHGLAGQAGHHLHASSQARSLGEGGPGGQRGVVADGLVRRAHRGRYRAGQDLAGPRSHSGGSYRSG